MNKALAIHIRFLTGRAHLHPWHAAPNEGRIEWPPSPWRLLRALVAVAGRGLTTLPEADQKETLADNWYVSATASPKGKGKKKHADVDPQWSHHADGLPLRALAELLSKLSSLPVVWLPRTGVGHTRHFFQTVSGHTTGSAVFDTFAAVDSDQPLVYEWSDVGLQETEREHLKLLLQGLPYFGRAESLCDVELKSEVFQPQGTHWPCAAVENELAFKQYFTNAGLREYRDYAIEKRLGWDASQLDFLRNNLNAKHSDEPELLLRSLLQSSGQSMKQGDRPWGTRWLHYAIPKEIFRLPVRRARRPSGNRQEECLPLPSFQVIRYAINSATVNRAVLPSITATLPIAERCRAAAMSIFGSQNSGLCSPQLSGKRYREDSRRYELFAEGDRDQVTKFDNENGSHRAHAYWWPVDEDGDGFLDHLIVLCPDGFSGKDVSALRALHRVGQSGMRADLLLTPISEGVWGECPTPWVSKEKTTEFVSATPYFCPVHLTRRSGKRRSLRDQIVQSLRQTGLSDDSRIEEIVFDYDRASLGTGSPDPRRQVMAHVQKDLRDATGQTLVDRGGFVVATLDVPSISVSNVDDKRYRGACLRDPDDAAPLGLSRGLLVSHGQRFVPALEFRRVRGQDDAAKGPGIMLRVCFGSPVPARPFAIGQFCHFGLGLCVPRIKQ
jgi:CRISPR-associated protein Csb2